jgi:hypothetical protein
MARFFLDDRYIADYQSAKGSMARNIPGTNIELGPGNIPPDEPYSST